MTPGGSAAFDASGFGTLYNIISWTPFNFMPAFIAVSGSKHFKCNPFIALWCCCTLINPGFTEMANSIAEGAKLKFLFIPMSGVTYSGTVIPAIVMVAVLAMLEKKLNKILPEDFRALFLPVCCVIIMVPLTVLLIGPVTTIVADAVAKGYQFLYGLVPWLANGICRLRKRSSSAWLLSLSALRLLPASAYGSRPETAR